MQVMAWYQEPFPVNIHHRHVLTPVVKPKDEALIGMEVFRSKNCQVRVNRRIKYSDGSYAATIELKDKEFGPIGADDYTMRVPSAPNAPTGKVEMWSQACSRCNPIQELSQYFEACAAPTVDTWTIGENTQYRPLPKGFKPSRDVAIPEK